MRFYLHPIILSLLLLSFFPFDKCYSQRNTVLDSIINAVEKNSVFKEKIDWKNAKASIYELVDENSADAIGPIIPAVQKLLTDLGDGHGGLYYNGKAIRGTFNSTRKIDSSLYVYAYDEQYAFRTKVIDGKYGYLAIPSPQIPFEAFKDKNAAIKYISLMAQQIQDSLCSLNIPELQGIIIDLRLSLGGNTPVLLSSMAPLIADNNIYAIDWADGTATPVHIQEGNLYEGDEILANTKMECSFKEPKIAILLGPLTNSASEQAAIAFKGKKNVKFIGEKTAGHLTMTKLIQFNDNLMFTYSGGFVKDRNGEVYPDYVNPDEEVIGGDRFESLENDAKVKAAIKWFEDE